MAAHAEAGLLNVSNTLYGTTFYGGARGCGVGCGTVFKVTTSGKVTLLHSFGASGHGLYPATDLVDVDGTLYGTTSEGGANGRGTVFAITTSGTETVLNGFGASGDGANPDAGVVNVNGTLYGTTVTGGASGDGTVFAITTAGAETVLYSLKGGSGDGAGPNAALLNDDGTLYGTTRFGGGVECRKHLGCGTVFSITPSGAEAVLHMFTGHLRDGAYPYADLLDVKGTLYGRPASEVRRIPERCSRYRRKTAGPAATVLAESRNML